jgi:hypothetical protein
MVKRRLKYRTHRDCERRLSKRAEAEESDGSDEGRAKERRKLWVLGREEACVRGVASIVRLLKHANGSSYGEIRIKDSFARLACLPHWRSR